MSVFMSGPPCFDPHSSVVSFEIGKCKSSNFVLLFQAGFVLAILGLLHFPATFRSSLSVSAKVAPGALLGVAVTLYSPEPGHCPLHHVRSSDHEHVAFPTYLTSLTMLCSFQSLRFVLLLNLFLKNISNAYFFFLCQSSLKDIFPWIFR